MVLRNISMLNFSLPKNSSQELKHKALRSRTATYIVLLRTHVSTLHSHWISMRLLYGVVQKSYPYGFYCCFFFKKSFVSSYRRKYWQKRSQNPAFNKKNNMTFTYHSHKPSTSETWMTTANLHVELKFPMGNNKPV